MYKNNPELADKYSWNYNGNKESMENDVHKILTDNNWSWDQILPNNGGRGKHVGLILLQNMIEKMSYDGWTKVYKLDRQQIYEATQNKETNLDSKLMNIWDLITKAASDHGYDYTAIMIQIGKTPQLPLSQEARDKQNKVVNFLWNLMPNSSYDQVFGVVQELEKADPNLVFDSNFTLVTPDQTKALNLNGKLNLTIYDLPSSWAGKTINIMNGNEVYGTLTIGPDGKCSLDNVPLGTYTLSGFPDSDYKLTNYYVMVTNDPTHMNSTDVITNSSNSVSSSSKVSSSSVKNSSIKASSSSLKSSSSKATSSSEKSSSSKVASLEASSKMNSNTSKPSVNIETSVKVPSKVSTISYVNKSTTSKVLVVVSSQVNTMVESLVSSEVHNGSSSTSIVAKPTLVSSLKNVPVTSMSNTIVNGSSAVTVGTTTETYSQSKVTNNVNSDNKSSNKVNVTNNNNINNGKLTIVGNNVVNSGLQDQNQGMINGQQSNQNQGVSNQNGQPSQSQGNKHGEGNGNGEVLPQTGEATSTAVVGLEIILVLVSGVVILKKKNN